MNPPVEHDREDEDWRQNRRLIFSQLKSVQEELYAARQDLLVIRTADLARMATEIEVLKVKNSIWAGLMGAVSGAITVISALFLHGGFK